MMLATLEALRAIGGSATVRELDEKVAELEGVSEQEQSHMMSNDDPRPRLNYYLAWARTYLRRGNAVENSSRGVWTITEHGKKITEYAQTKRIHEEINAEERKRSRLKRLEARKEETGSASEHATGHKAGPQDEGASNESWKANLLDVLRGMSPDGFERLVQRLLRESGFIKVEVRGKSGDGGIDGVGILRVNLVSFQVFFQCKKWKGSVGATEIRDFRGAMQGRADKGLFITAGSFTSQALDEATRDGAIAIDLIDGDRLCDLLKEFSLGVRTENIERVSIDTSWFSGI